DVERENDQDHERSATVEPGRQLIDGGGGERRIGDAEPENGGVSQPEGQAGDEADFRNLHGGQSPGRIDAVANRAAGEYARADIMAHRIAGEARERSRPIRTVRP